MTGPLPPPGQVTVKNQVSVSPCTVPVPATFAGPPPHALVATLSRTNTEWRAPVPDPWMRSVCALPSPRSTDAHAPRNTSEAAQAEPAGVRTTPAASAKAAARGAWRMTASFIGGKGSTRRLGAPRGGDHVRPLDRTAHGDGQGHVRVRDPPLVRPG